MSRLTRAASPVALLVAVLALVVSASAIGAGTAVAAGQIGPKQIRNGAVTGAKLANGSVSTAKLANNAVTGAKVRDRSLTVNDLAPSSVSALRGKPTYWAFVTQAGSVGRGSPGVSAISQLNSGFWQYRVTFPVDVSACGYQVSSGDTTPIGANEFVIPAFLGVTRSSEGPRTLAVNAYSLSGQSIQDTFYIAVLC